MLHPVVDIQWRVEVQTLNGLNLPDQVMFVKSAVVEFAEPSRAEIGTSKSFALALTSDLRVELPANMPLKTMPEEDSDEAGSQRVITKAFLNWLPFTGDLGNHLRHPMRVGENEYVFSNKRLYFQSKETQLMSHLPYFSNCRGFGRTIPLWAMTELNQGCNWTSSAEEITLMSLGAEAVGDSCADASVECLLDEIPNVKMINDRWFEAQTGTLLFYMTRNAFQASELEGASDVDIEPVYLMQGVQGKGPLPRKVVLLFQYWQQTPTEKTLAAGKAYYTDFEDPPEDILRGRAKWNYTLTTLYFPMTHFEVMVNFAFPFEFYFVLYIAVGCVCIAMVAVLWSYHRFFCRLSYPPHLFDNRHFNVVMPPLITGFLMAAVVCAIPMILWLGLVRGQLFIYQFPWAICAESQLVETCFLGILDWVQSSYSGETEVTQTTFGDRRTGRTGTSLVVMGGYVVVVSLKLLVPANDSRYYQREDKTGGNTVQALLGEDDNPDGDKSVKDSEMLTEKDEHHDPELMPIFTTHLWKRSCLALLMYTNAIFQQMIIMMSFSDLFRDWVLWILIFLHMTRSAIKLALTDYMCETLLVVPMHTVSQVTYFVALLASKTLFDFLVAYILVLAISIIDRVYLSPSEDFAIAKVVGAYRRMSAWYKWVVNAKRGGKGSNKPPEDDDESEDDIDPRQTEAEEKDHHAAEAEGDTEDMIGFVANLSVTSMGNLLAPCYFALCSWLYDESKILYRYSIRVENATYYVFFYAVMLIFQFLIDFMSINIVEIFHGWHVMDYLEYCAYRYKTRYTDWKGKEHTYDEMMVPHQRSVDNMCFSVQYYYVNILCATGMMGWIFGMQVIFENNWNLFDDPASPMIMLGALAICRGGHLMVLTMANYLNIWRARKKTATMMEQEYQKEILQSIKATSAQAAFGAAPKAPPGSAHEGWPEPAPYDAKGMERYRMAFLNENQQWLQATFSELNDRKLIIQHREALLKSLTELLSEVPPERYAPEGEDGRPEAGMAFGSVPSLTVARAAGEVQRGGFQGSIAHELVVMWRQRAQFMLHLQRISNQVKLDNRIKRDSCELCGRQGELLVTPIYTLTHLASSYRQQRDMSPLWNTPLWQHFYQTFTPTCTLCDKCSNHYYHMNMNIPVDEQRFQRLQAKKKTPYKVVMESDLPIAPIDPDAVKVLQLWLAWVRDLCKGEEPRVFLPKYGLEGRTAAEIRKAQMLLEAQEDGVSLPSMSDEEGPGDDLPPLPVDEDSDLDDEAKKKKKRKFIDPKTINLEEEDDLDRPPPPRVPARLSWSDRAILDAWLSRARESLRAPQLQNWARPLPLPKAPSLPPPPGLPGDDHGGSGGPGLDGGGGGVRFG